jgi:ferredoxin
MATTIIDDCINCGVCEDECPNSAISMGDDIFVIDPTLCTECVGHHEEQMCAAVCPPEACVQDSERVEAEETLFERAQKIHSDRSLTLTTETSHFRAKAS